MDRFNFEEDDPSHSDDGRYVLYEDVKKLEADKQALEERVIEQAKEEARLLAMVFDTQNKLNESQDRVKELEEVLKNIYFDEFSFISDQNAAIEKALKFPQTD